jgi:predicted HD superfamily hydrolase involved in NAD metabolism
MDITCIKEKLEKTLTPKRYLHSLNVMQTAILLADRYGENTGNAALAGLLHDCARDIIKEETLELCDKFGIKTDDISRLHPVLLHGYLGSRLAKDNFGVECHSVLKAIECHTMGSPGMDLLGKIIFVADYIEPARSFPGAEEIRKAAFEDINRAMLLGIYNTIRHILDIGGLLHPETVTTRNWLLLEMKRGGLL